MQLLVCDLTGQPRGQVDVSSLTATTSLNEPGDAEFTLRAKSDLYQFMAPWAGMLVLTTDLGEPLWCGVPVKRRGQVGSGELEVSAREWPYWLSKVAPLIYDSATPPFDDYGDYEGLTGVKAGFVVADLMGRVPQNRPGLTLCPLQPPDSQSGSVVVLGDLALDAGRPSVWDALQPLRDRGVEMWARTTFEAGRYVPRMVVGDPRIGNESPVPLWLGGNVAAASIEEDGEWLATRWRVKGVDSVEVFADEVPGLVIPEGRLLLDGIKDYSDQFADSADELTELQTRAIRMLRGSLSPARWFTEIEIGPEVRLEPGDAVMVSSPALAADPRVVEEFEVEARVASLTYSETTTSVELIQPQFDEAPLPSRRSLGRLLRDMGMRLSVLGMR